MKVRIDARAYTNLVLTVIAVVLVAGAVRDYGMAFLPTAQAQQSPFQTRTTADDLRRSAQGTPFDTSIPQTQDVAVAAATSEVAASNREIAEALREVATAIREGLGDVTTNLGRTAAPVSAGGAVPAAAPAAAGERPTVEVR